MEKFIDYVLQENDVNEERTMKYEELEIDKKTHKNKWNNLNKYYI